MPQVLLAVDGDEGRAQAQAETVLHLFDPEKLEVDLLHVFQNNPEGASVEQVGSVRRAREVLEDAGVRTTTRGESGDPVERIVSYGDELDTDAICLAGRKRSPAGKAVFGSTSQEVVLDTKRPVLFCDAASR